MKLAQTREAACEPRRPNRFQKIIDCSGLECPDRVVVESGHEDDIRTSGSVQLARDFKSVHPGHLHVQEHQFGLKRLDPVNGLHSVLSLTDDVDLRSDGLDLIREDRSRDRFIVHNDLFGYRRTELGSDPFGWGGYLPSTLATTPISVRRPY